MGESARLIAIAGGSCTGKTTLAHALARAMHDSGALVLSMDRYYRDLSDIPAEKRGLHNFDHPDAVDHLLLIEQVQELVAGRGVEAPLYDFRTHTRQDLGEHFAAVGWLVLEGLHALQWEALSRLADLRVFVHLDHETCLARRIERDRRERGRTEESVRAQYAETVRPMSEQYIEPTRARADIVVHGDQPIEESVRAILSIIK